MHGKLVVRMSNSFRNRDIEKVLCGAVLQFILYITASVFLLFWNILGSKHIHNYFGCRCNYFDVVEIGSILLARLCQGFIEIIIRLFLIYFLVVNNLLPFYSVLCSEFLSFSIVDQIVKVLESVFYVYFIFLENIGRY